MEYRSTHGQMENSKEDRKVKHTYVPTYQIDREPKLTFSCP